MANYLLQARKGRKTGQQRAIAVQEGCSSGFRCADIGKRRSRKENWLFFGGESSCEVGKLEFGLDS